MKPLEENPEGYNKSAINRLKGFNHTRFLLAAGTGDDNVHIQHSANLVYKLTRAKISTDMFRVHYITDANHHMSYKNNGANNSEQNMLMNMIKKFFCSDVGLPCYN